MATTKEKLLVLEIKANGHYIRQVAVTCRRGTSVIRNLKFLTPFFSPLIIKLLTIILSTNRSYVISPYVTNIYLKVSLRPYIILR